MSFFGSAVIPAVSTALTAEVTLSSAQIRALHTTPVQLIAAPSAGHAIVIDSIFAQLNLLGNDEYDTGESVRISYNDGNGGAGNLIAILDSGLLGRGEAYNQVQPENSVIVSGAYSILANVAVADPGNVGNSIDTLYLKLFYHLQSIS